MKHALVVLFLILSVGHSSAEESALVAPTLKEIWFPDDEYSEGASIEAQMQSDSYERGGDIDNLIRAKFQMVNGNLKLAKFYLGRINDKSSKLVLIKRRYLAIISFIDGKFAESLDYLSDKRFFDASLYPQVCLIKLINYMAINDVLNLGKEKESCKFYAEQTSRNDAFWLDTMIKLKMKNTDAVRANLITDVERTLSDDEMSRLWLKTGLYLNREKDLLEILSILPENSYQSKRLREIVAFMYLRTGIPADKQKALSFIDDIDSANAENIKGNINLQNKEYELAFGHFRLALAKKQDSTNSLERAIPLSWMLSEWKDGISMLDGDINRMLDPRNKQAIRIAFLIREKKFDQAALELAHLKIDFKNSPPFEVDLMDSYVSLINSPKDKKFDIRKVEDSTENACRSFDGISCWTSMQFIQWDNLGKTITRDEDVFADTTMTLDSLKEKKEIKPLKEAITVDQKDIEELDSAGIELGNVLSK